MTCRLVIRFVHAPYLDVPLISGTNNFLTQLAHPQASGIKPSPECLSAYQRLKIKEADVVKLEYVIYKIQSYPPQEGKKPDIVVEKESTEANYEDFIENFHEDDCRWGIFDFEYDSGEGMRKKIIFVTWYVPSRLQDIVLEDGLAHGVISGLLIPLKSKRR